MKELPDIVTASAYWYWDWYKNGGTFIGIPLKRYYPAWYETEEDIDAWKALDPENRKNTWILPMSDHTRDPQEYMPGEIDYEEFVTYSYGALLVVNLMILILLVILIKQIIVMYILLRFLRFIW